MKKKKTPSPLGCGFGLKATSRKCILFALMALLLSACTPSRQSDSSDMSDQSDSSDLSDMSDVALRWADSVASSMTLEQLAGQLFLPAVFSDSSPASLRAIASYAADSHVGGVVLLKGNVAAAQAISDTLRALSAAPPFIAIDAEWGLAMRLNDTPRFPKNGQISEKAEENLLYEYGSEVASECRQVGINMVLGPVLDVLPSGGMKGASAVVGNRSFGSDPERVAALGVAYARGLEDGGVLSVAKHFPGHGAADADSHRTLPLISKSRKALETSDLLPFRRYVDHDLGGVMVAHVKAPALDPSGLPASVSPALLKGLLRDSLGFRGLVITDAMNMAGADGFAGADAIIAGADLVLAPASTEEEVRTLLAAVRTGRLSVAALRSRVRRVLFHKYFVLSESEGGGFRPSPEASRISSLLSK